MIDPLVLFLVVLLLSKLVALVLAAVANLVAGRNPGAMYLECKEHLEREREIIGPGMIFFDIAYACQGVAYIVAAYLALSMAGVLQAL